MKKAFSLVMAIFFVIIIATLGLAALRFSANTVKQSSDIYLREQAELLAISAAEVAIMAMQDHDYTNNCLENVQVFYPANGAGALLRANVAISYLDNKLPGTCNTKISNINSSLAGVDNIALLDISVTSLPGASTEPIRFYKRIIQRP